MDTSRRYDIDWLRVIAIALLIIYHIAIIFQPWAMFIGFIRSDDLIIDLWKPMTLLNVWRIPFLFFVSGMGVYFAMQKRNIKALLTDRALRILLPYVFGIVAIVPLQFFLFQRFHRQELSYFAHPAHLWFLGNIAIYISILFPLFFYWMRNPDSRFRSTLKKLMSNPLGPISISLFFVLEALLLKPEVFALYAQTAHGYLIGFLAFFFGFLLVYIGEEFWQTTLKARGLYAGLAIILATFRFAYMDGTSPNYLMSIESILWILALFGFGYRYLNQPSKALDYLSKMSYPVYIIHMVVLHAAASIILPLDVPPIGKFILVILVSMLLCFLLFEFVIKRLNIFRPLFGMKLRKGNF